MGQVQREFTYNGVIFGNSPLLKYTIAYLSGILIGSKYTLSPSVLLILTGSISIFSLLIYYLCYKNKSSLLEYTLIFLIVAAFVSLGWLNICISSYSDLKIENSRLKENAELWTDCVVGERPVKKANSNKVTVSLPVFDEGMILYLDKNFPDSLLEVGDTIRAKLIPKRIKNNAGSRFDYARYLEKKGIYSSSYVRANDIILLKLKGISVKNRISVAKGKYIRKITKLIGSGKEAATLIAITIGDKSYLDSDIKNDYSKSGTMHLLAVSGLHVGFIYSFFSLFLIILGNSRLSRILRFVIITALLWCYTSIVGFAPSVSRAVIMATLYEICKMLEREKIGLNTLSLSAFIITITEPQAIFDVGFQLSFAALLSILIIHPKIDEFYLPANRITKYVWSTVSITLACQIGTSLISISTFGFFPTYFLLSNLIAIPLSAIILYMALGQLLFINFDMVSKIIANVLRFLLKLMNGTVERVESLPCSTIDVSFNNGQIISLLMFIILYTFDIIHDHLYKRYICLGLIVNFILCSL
ncbi:MAG: ComEC/Rec2 family competence protein [Bacteroidales bacterium]